MKYSKWSAALLALAIVLQLAVPALFIAEHSAILREGTEYRIRLTLLEFDDDVIGLNYDIANGWDDRDMRFAALRNASDGVYRSIELKKTPPEDGAAFKSASVRKFRLPIDEYACPGVKEASASQKYSDLLQQDHWFYSTVKIRDRKAVLTGVYLDDGTPVEEVFR